MPSEQTPISVSARDWTSSDQEVSSFSSPQRNSSPVYSASPAHQRRIACIEHSKTASNASSNLEFWVRGSSIFADGAAKLRSRAVPSARRSHQNQGLTKQRSVSSDYRSRAVNQSRFHQPELFSHIIPAISAICGIRSGFLGVGLFIVLNPVSIPSRNLCISRVHRSIESS